MLPNMTDTVAIQVHDLHKHFGQVEALRGIDLQVARGQIFGLLGPNGAGKTTLIRLLTGATKPTRGHLSILDLDPVRQKRALRRQIGYMPQSPALYEDISALENLRFFGRAHPVENLPQKVDEAIAFVGLSGRAQDPVHTFSGGMKQRVSLACALVHQPQVLLLDEPTSGIDPELRAAFWGHFRQLAGQGVTILVSTHQMDEALHCDRLAILHQGVVLAENTPQRLLWSGRTRITLWRGGSAEAHDVKDYPQQLPALLQHHGLDAAVDRIEVDKDSLEEIVLRLINQHDDHTIGGGHDS